MTLATLADLIGFCINYTDRFLIYPLIGQSEEERNQEFYKIYLSNRHVHDNNIHFSGFRARCCINYESLYCISISSSPQKGEITVTLL